MTLKLKIPILIQFLHSPILSLSPTGKGFRGSGESCSTQPLTLFLREFPLPWEILLSLLWFWSSIYFKIFLKFYLFIFNKVPHFFVEPILVQPVLLFSNRVRSKLVLQVLILFCAVISFTRPLYPWHFCVVDIVLESFTDVFFIFQKRNYRFTFKWQDPSCLRPENEQRSNYKCMHTHTHIKIVALSFGIYLCPPIIGLIFPKKNLIFACAYHCRKEIQLTLTLKCTNYFFVVFRDIN